MPGAKPSDAGTRPPPLIRGLRKAVQHLRGDESAALLAAAWASSKGQDTLELQLVKGATRETLFLGSGTLFPNPDDPGETRFRFNVQGGRDAQEEYSSDDETTA